MADNRYYGGITVGAAGFEIGAQAPVDSRFRVKNAEGLNELLTYEGLVSYNEADKKYYQFRDGAWRAISVNTAEELAAIISAQIAAETTGAMEFKGAAATLPENPGKGDMYKVAGENINIVIDGKTAKAGDTIIYNDKWYLIPSGDDIEDTWRPVNIAGNELGGEEALKVVAGENVTITKKDDGSFEIASQYEDTHYESKLVVGNETADVNDENVENGNVHLNLVEDGVVKSSHKIVGAGGITVKHTKAADEDGVNVITIEAPEGAKYDLAAKTVSGEVILSLAGTDNTEDKVAIVGDDYVNVAINNEGKVAITAAADVQTKLGYVDTNKNVSTAISDAIDALFEEGGAVNDIIRDNGTIDTKITTAIGDLELDTTYVAEEGFEDRVKNIKVNEAVQAEAALYATDATNAENAVTAGHADTATNATNAEKAVEATKVSKALSVTIGGEAKVFDGSAEVAVDVDAAIEAAKAELIGENFEGDKSPLTLHELNDDINEAFNQINTLGESKVNEEGFEDRVKAIEVSFANYAESAGNASEATHAGNADYAHQAYLLENSLIIKVGGTDLSFNGGADDVVADVDTAIKNAIDAIPAAPEYSIVKAADSGDYAAVYNLTKNGTAVGAAINIPKDLVVKSGSVVTNPTGQPAGTYIELVLQNQEAPLYINVGNLIEYVTSGSAQGDMVVIAIDETTHKVTATITDGTVTEAKLHDDVKAKLNKAWATVEQGQAADSALQSVKILGKELTKTANELTVDEAKTALGLKDAAYETVADIRNGVIGTADDTATSDTVKGAKKYADSLASNYATATQGGKADSALQTIETGTGLKVTEKADNKQTISIDEDVIFVLNCNY